MPRSLALVLVILTVPFLLAADPLPVEKQLSLQKAMVTARQFLDVNMPAEAVSTLEAEIASADGSKAFLNLLREAYLADLYRLEKAANPDASRIAQLRRHLALLGDSAAPTAPVSAPPVPAASSATSSAPPAPPPPADLATPLPDRVALAVDLFKKNQFAQADKLFAQIGADKLTAVQKTAWAYCLVKVAADRLNAGGIDSTTAAAVAGDVAEALALAPQHVELQKVGQQVLTLATSKSNGRRAPVSSAEGDVVETPSFRIRHSGQRELAESIAKAAESQRKYIFERWSGPPAGPWAVKCEIVIHSTGESFAKTTGRPAGATGNAAVRLTDGRAETRRIDLRADDDSLVENALPRELTHVVLADLFPNTPAPKWAVEGMAILATTPEEMGRYTRTLGRCARDGEWLGVAQLLEMKDFPADKITAFYCESVSLTEYLIRTGGGERNFTIFLRDCQRYGNAQALKRQFSIDGPQALEAAWKRAATEAGSKQFP